MGNSEFLDKKLLSDDALTDVVGGITSEEYAPIKAQLDTAAASDDFDAFKSIVYENYPTYGSDFMEAVLGDYIGNGYLTVSKAAKLNAGIQNIST